jgi:hypothetical protein
MSRPFGKETNSLPGQFIDLHANQGNNMSDWLHNLPVVWMAVVVFGVTYLIAVAIYAVVMSLATGERARAFKAVSPGMLPPLGILFASSSHSLLSRSGTITIGQRRQSIVRLAR